MKIIRTIFWTFLLLIAASLLIGNSDWVTIGLWPLPTTVSATVGFVVVASIIFGVILGLVWQFLTRIFRAK